MCYCRCWAHLERQETERIYDRAQELVDQTCQNKSLKASEWFLYLCSSSGAKVMPKIFSAAVLCKCFQTAKPAPSLSMTAEIRPNWVWLFCQFITTAFFEEQGTKIWPLLWPDRNHLRARSLTVSFCFLPARRLVSRKSILLLFLAASRSWSRL